MIDYNSEVKLNGNGIIDYFRVSLPLILVLKQYLEFSKGKPKDDCLCWFNEECSDCPLKEGFTNREFETCNVSEVYSKHYNIATISVMLKDIYNA